MLISYWKMIPNCPTVKQLEWRHTLPSWPTTAPSLLIWRIYWKAKLPLSHQTKELSVSQLLDVEQTRALPVLIKIRLHLLLLMKIASKVHLYPFQTKCVHSPGAPLSPKSCFLEFELCYARCWDCNSYLGQFMLLEATTSEIRRRKDSVGGH